MIGPWRGLDGAEGALSGFLGRGRGALAVGARAPWCVSLSVPQEVVAQTTQIFSGTFLVKLEWKTTYQVRGTPFTSAPT